MYGLMLYYLTLTLEHGRNRYSLGVPGSYLQSFDAFEKCSTLHKFELFRSPA